MIVSDSCLCQDVDKLQRTMDLSSSVVFSSWMDFAIVNVGCLFCGGVVAHEARVDGFLALLALR